VRESSGLRFDIYERVRLPEEAAEIREIEEIELTPCVQAETRGEQVVLRGSLLLSGVYQSDDESRASRQLEHWIPVEITLPRERVIRPEDLAVEVDNFDVDLLDGRTLNITGVLTLQGVAADASAARNQTYAWGDEPYTVVHRRGREVTGEAGGASAGGTGRADDAPGVSAEEALQPAGTDARAFGGAAPAEGESSRSGAAGQADEAFGRAAGDSALPAGTNAQAADDAHEEAASARGAQDAAEWTPASGTEAREAANASRPSGAETQEQEVGVLAGAGNARTSQASGIWEPAAVGSARTNLEPAPENGAFAPPSGGPYPVKDEDPAPERVTAEWRSAGGRDADDKSGSAGAAGPLDWRSFAAHARAGGADGAEAERRTVGTTGDGDAGSGTGTSDARGEAGDAAGAGAEQADVPPAAEARNDAQPEVAQPSAAEETSDAAPEAVGASAAESGSGSRPASGRSDLRVALGTKRDAGTSDADGTPGIGKLFFPERRETRGESDAKAQEVRDPEQEPEPAETERRQASSDEVDWRTLFGGAAAQESFRTVRLCIVQKDDTLESIALRYQRNPREIALANRLEDSSLTEGQVLYIP